MAKDVFGIVGRVIADAYEVEQVTSESDFATIYRAKHGGFGAPVALKCLQIPPTLPSADREKFAARFHSEAQLLFRLSAASQHVVRPLHADAFLAPDGRWVPFLVLEWLEGENLAELAARRRAQGSPPFSLEELVPLLEPVARALTQLAELDAPAEPGLCHAELKPENLLLANVAGRRMIKIVDFGLAKVKRLANEVTLPTLPGQSKLGLISASYAAPEQWLPDRYGPIGPWTDVWGLALSCVGLMAGRRVFEGDEAAIMHAVLDPGRRPTPLALGVKLSAAVDAVFARALALDPEQRHPNAGALWDALKSAMAASSTSQRAPVSAIPDLEIPGSKRTFGASPARQPARKTSSASMPAVLSVPAPSSSQRHDLEPSFVEVESTLGVSHAPQSGGRLRGAPESPNMGLGVDDLLDEPLDYGHALELETEDAWSPAAPASGSKLVVDAPVPSARAGTPPAPDPSEVDLPQKLSVRGNPPGPPLPSSDPDQTGTEAPLRAVQPSPLRFKPPKPKTRLGRMAPGLVLLAAAIGLTFFGQLYAAISGDVLALGPISGILLGVGAVWVGYHWFRSPL